MSRCQGRICRRSLVRVKSPAVTARLTELWALIFASASASSLPMISTWTENQCRNAEQPASWSAVNLVESRATPRLALSGLCRLRTALESRKIGTGVSLRVLFTDHSLLPLRGGHREHARKCSTASPTAKTTCSQITAELPGVSQRHCPICALQQTAASLFHERHGDHLYIFVDSSVVPDTDSSKAVCVSTRSAEEQDVSPPGTRELKSSGGSRPPPCRRPTRY